MNKPKCEYCNDTGEVEVEPSPQVIAQWHFLSDEIKEACRRAFCPRCAVGRRKRREEDDCRRRNESADLH
jgi:hypothetical protein